MWTRRVGRLEKERLVTGDDWGKREAFRKEKVNLEAQFGQMSMGKRLLKGACSKRWVIGGIKKKRESRRSFGSFASQG